MPYCGFSVFLIEDDVRLSRNGLGSSLNSTGGNVLTKGKVRVESVVEAANFAANGQPCEVVYYPRAGTPEFVVKASQLKAALQIRWCAGMRFKMPFETEDSSRISWFMGIISSVQVAYPMRWPDSPWRLLQVTWDEPDLLQNVKRVSPWLVELVSNIPAIHLSPFSPPRKKFRFPQHPDFPMEGHLLMPTIPGNFLGPNNPFVFLPENSPTGMQGARHAQFGLSLPDLHLSKLHPSLLPAGFTAFDPNGSSLPSRPSFLDNPRSSENVSCLLTIGNSTETRKRSGDPKTYQFILFGKPILTEQQMSLSRSMDRVSPIRRGNSSSEGNADKEKLWYKDSNHRQTIDLELDPGQCKVFMESEDVGWILDLSLLKSSKELCLKLANMFGMEGSVMLNHVTCSDFIGSA